MTVGEMRAEVRQGARFVVFEYVLSFLLVTRRKTSVVFFIRPGESVLLEMPALQLAHARRRLVEPFPSGRLSRSGR